MKTMSVSCSPLWFIIWDFKPQSSNIGRTPVAILKEMPLGLRFSLEECGTILKGLSSP